MARCRPCHFHCGDHWSSFATKCSSEGACMIAWHADESSVIFVHEKDQGGAAGPGLKSRRSWRMARAQEVESTWLWARHCLSELEVHASTDFSSICGGSLLCWNLVACPALRCTLPLLQLLSSDHPGSGALERSSTVALVGSLESSGWVQLGGAAGHWRWTRGRWSDRQGRSGGSGKASGSPSTM